jgi:predicted N-acetyltransferase YhbS
MTIQIRESVDADSRAIADLVLRAFGASEGEEIRDLIADLLVDQSARPLLSLVASAKQQLVGHILFSHATIEHASREDVPAAILAPLAVQPEAQRQGIGGRLIREGLARLSSAGADLVFVLGYPAYYTRHGFVPAAHQGFESPYPIPVEHADAWMVQALRSEVPGSISGRVHCANALRDPKYWRE